MAYTIYLDGVALPVAPSKIELKVKNQNKTLNLINDGEINILKDAGLTEINFEAMIPNVRYPFAVYPSGFQPASFFLDKLENLKTDKKPFQFICSRSTPSGELLFDTNLKVSIETYTVTEDVKEGQDLGLSITLKQYKEYGTKKVNISTSQAGTQTATAQPTRSTEKAPSIKSYTVKSGDTLWNIAKKYLGNGSKYTEIYNLNTDKISNPNTISVGQVLIMPS